MWFTDGCSKETGVECDHKWTHVLSASLHAFVLYCTINQNRERFEQHAVTFYKLRFEQMLEQGQHGQMLADFWHLCCGWMLGNGLQAFQLWQHACTYLWTGKSIASLPNWTRRTTWAHIALEHTLALISFILYCHDTLMPYQKGSLHSNEFTLNCTSAQFWETWVLPFSID